MRVVNHASLVVKMKIPIPVLVSTQANLFIRDLRSRGELTIESVVNTSVFADKLRENPRQTLNELITRLENPLPTDYWPGVEYGLILLLFQVTGTLGISAPEDAWHIDRKHLFEWFKWVRLWFSSVK